MWWIVILLLFGAVVVAAIAPALRPPLAVRPPATIELFDAHPRHVCRGDTVTANWRGWGDSGLLTATIFAPVPPFFRQSLGPSSLPEGRTAFRADTTGGFSVELTISRSRVPSASRSVTIFGHDSPNERIRLDAQLAFTRVPHEGWVGRRVFSSDPAIDIDDWSPRITVAGLEYRGEPGRDVEVSWRGTVLATLSTAFPSHANSLVVTVAGEWRLFVAARPGEGPTTSPPDATVYLMPRCGPG